MYLCDKQLNKYLYLLVIIVDLYLELLNEAFSLSVSLEITNSFQIFFIYDTNIFNLFKTRFADSTISALFSIKSIFKDALHSCKTKNRKCLINSKFQNAAIQQTSRIVPCFICIIKRLILH